jgi:NADH:ubiquinone oxidoreductase subunit C
MIALPSAVPTERGQSQLTMSCLFSSSKVSPPKNSDHLHVVYHLCSISVDRKQSIRTHVYPATDVHSPSASNPEHAYSMYKLSSWNLPLESE